MTALTGPTCDAGRCSLFLAAFAEAKERWRSSAGERAASWWQRALDQSASLSTEQRAELMASLRSVMAEDLGEAPR